MNTCEHRPQKVVFKTMPSHYLLKVIWGGQMSTNSPSPGMSNEKNDITALFYTQDSIKNHNNKFWFWEKLKK